MKPPTSLTKNLKGPDVYYGVLNPKGEKNGSDTTYFEENQLKQIASELEGLDLYINHQTENKKGEEIRPCGKVIGSALDKEGKLWCAVVPFDDANGNLAKHFLDHDKKEFQMGSFSMGYDVAMNGNGKVIGNRPTEVSICFEGARKGTQIMGKIPLKEFLQKGSMTISKYKEENPSDDQIKTQVDTPTDQKYIKDTNETNLSDIEQLVETMNVQQQNTNTDEVDSSKFVGRNGSVIIPPAVPVDMSKIPPVKNYTPEPKFEVVRAAASTEQEATPQPPQPSAATEVPASVNTPSTTPAQEVSQLDSLLNEVFPNGLPKDAPTQEQQDSPIDKTILPNVEDIKFPEDVSTGELKKMLLELSSKYEDLKRSGASDKERDEIDTLEKREKWKKIIPMIEKIQEIDDGSLKKFAPKWEELRNTLMEKPGMGSLAITNLLSAAASLVDNGSKAQKRSADTLEAEYQTKRKMQKVISLQNDQINKLRSEVDTFKNSKSMFEVPNERVVVKAAASNQLAPSVSQEDQDFMNSAFFQAASRDNHAGRGSNVVMARAKFTDQLFKEYGSTSTSGQMGTEFNDLFA